MMGRVLSILSLFFLVILLVFIALSLVNCHQVREEVKNFEVKPWRIRSCPFPMGLRVTHPELKTPTKKAAAEINREVGLALGYGQIYTDERFAPKDNPTIEVYDGSATHAYRGGVCEPLLFGPGAMNDNVRVASFYPGISDWKLNLGLISFCLEKHKSTKAVLDEKFKVRLREAKFYLKHELMHPIMGSNHMKWGCGITCAAPTWGYVVKEELEVIRRHYDGYCLKLPGEKRATKKTQE